MQSKSVLRGLWVVGLALISFIFLFFANYNGVSGYFSSFETIRIFGELGLSYYGEAVVYSIVLVCVFYCLIGSSFATSKNGQWFLIPIISTIATLLVFVSIFSLNALAFNNLYVEKIVQDYLSGNISKRTYSKLMYYAERKNNLLDKEEKLARMKEVQPIIRQLSNGDFGFIEKQGFSIKNPSNAPLLTDDEYYPSLSPKVSSKKEKLNSDFIDSSYHSSDLLLEVKNTKSPNHKTSKEKGGSDIIVGEIVEHIFCDKPCSNGKKCSGVASECKKSSCSSDCR